MNNPALEAHEHREHAEHAAHEKDPFIASVSITIAVLAVLAAAAGSMENVEGGRAITASSEAVLLQDRATDAWNEFQADSLKRHMYEIAADTVAAKADGYRKSASGEAGKQKGSQALAKKDEEERDRLAAESATHENRENWLTGATTLIEIGIALSTVAIITRRKAFWFGAMALGVVGVVLFGAAYLT
ncbi:MAG TPA: DUF4337 family protein [Rhizomicrobium sp.]|nr:DUF4337 family protein [Rhizomicrobium sp.]HEX4532866.1 DUF4337 family protein [Rhizomicrobium sp.]